MGIKHAHNSVLGGQGRHATAVDASREVRRASRLLGGAAVVKILLAGPLEDACSRAALQMGLRALDVVGARAGVRTQDRDRKTARSQGGTCF